MLRVRIKPANWSNDLYLEIDGKLVRPFPVKARGKEFYFRWDLGSPKVKLKKAPNFRNHEKFEKWLKNHLPRKRLERFLTGILGQKVIVNS